MGLLQMLKSQFLTHLLMCYVFLLSGLIINLLQICTLPLWLVSKQLARRVNIRLGYCISSREWPQTLTQIREKSGVRLLHWHNPPLLLPASVCAILYTDSVFLLLWMYSMLWLESVFHIVVRACAPKHEKFLNCAVHALMTVKALIFLYSSAVTLK